MRGGNLSNELAPAMGIRFENIIKTVDGKLNRAAKAYLEKLDSQDIRLVVITTDKRRALAFMTKWRVPYSQVLEAESSYEIAELCRENDFIFYFDVDTDVLHSVRSRGPKIAAEKWEHFETT